MQTLLIDPRTRTGYDSRRENIISYGMIKIEKPAREICGYRCLECPHSDCIVHSARRPGRPAQIKATEIILIAEEYRRGKPIIEISDTHKISQPIIYYYLRKNCIKLRGNGKNIRKKVEGYSA